MSEVLETSVVDAVERPEYGRCPECGALSLPVMRLLPCGHDGDPIVDRLAEQGIVYSWTRVWPDPETSTVLVMADFLDGALRVGAPLVGAAQIEIGAAVEALVGSATPLALTPAGGTA